MILNKKFAVLSLSLVLSILLTACGSKLADAGKDTLLADSSDAVSFSSLSGGVSAPLSAPASTLEKEINGLSLILAPLFDAYSPRFVGEANKIYLQSVLLNTEDTGAPLPVSDFEKILGILLSFDEKSVQDSFQANREDGSIHRRYALSGFMKLLELKYQSLTPETDYEKLKKSEILEDLDLVADEDQLPIRQAYCLGFTDYTLDGVRLFRPADPMTFGETISVLYRTLTNLGLPPSAELSASETAAAVMRASGLKSSVLVTDAFSIENIRTEYSEYLSSLAKLNNSTAKAKIALLEQASDIIGIDPDSDSVSETLSMGQWRQLLHDIFGIESDQMDPYLSYETNGVLPYDVAAISIFKLSDSYGGYEVRDATAEELEKARELIPQFDTARDISKFAQMLSSGLLDGLYKIPGFTPQRPVNKAEALLIVKRILQNTKLK